MSASIGRISAVALACFSFAALLCTSLETAVSGGTGSETVIGRIMNKDGSPASETTVEMRPYSFDPVSGQGLSECGADTTDSFGRYVITLGSPTVKRYTLQAVNLTLRTGTIIPDIDLSAPSETTLIADATLYKTGSIKVILTDSSIAGNGYVFIPGAAFSAFMENGIATIDSVPAVTVPRVCYHDINGTGTPLSLAEAIDVKQGIVTIVAFSGAAHAAKIILNTTSGGAGVAGNVYEFPALIRLSSTNFIFNEARTDGSDLRFTKPDNTPLPFEIERWNVAARLAEIWVKVDTVYGNDSVHFVVMYWGEPATAIALDHARVFDTTGGFRGVWHLAEEAAGVGTKGLYKDATGRNNGDDFIGATDRSGIIGCGHAFDGIDDFIPVNGPVTTFLKGDVTVALWVNIPDSGGTILSKLDTVPGWNVGELSLYFGDGTNTHVAPGVNGARPSFVGYWDDYAIAAQPVPSDEWHYLVYAWTWNGDTTGTPRYYLDGTETALSRDFLNIRSDDSARATIRIGQPNNNESYAFFKGLMDELEISAVTRSPDWIKLCYMNQKLQNSLTKW
ncbi:MAG: DUF2341 domain-containing protein [Chitinispirillaceae bacterium]|nr:DUF2341 domain-containing protein [Chitinispirillaceae bacterium]